MSDSKITAVAGKGLPLSGNDIDTDRIIPARFMKVVTFDGLGEFAFQDDREQLAEKGETHPFAQDQFQGCNILVVNANFGCGSSREHAPQALQRWGIDALIGESFAEIFAGNCTSLGMPVLTGDTDTIAQLQDLAAQGVGFEVNVETAVVTAGGQEFQLSMDAGMQSRLVSGQWDALGILRSNADKVEQTIAAVPYISSFAN